jgi:hypothetical protein
MNFSPTVDKAKLLETLHKNLAEHEQIVREAREGHRKKVVEALTERLKVVQEGGPIELHFGLKAPVDYSHHYRNAIRTMEWAEEEKVVLDPNDFQQLVLNQWSWQREFMVGNALYSQTAASGCLAMGY